MVEFLYFSLSLSNISVRKVGVDKVRRYALLLVLEANFPSFHSTKALCMKDEDFKELVENPSTFSTFTLQDGFLLNGNEL